MEIQFTIKSESIESHKELLNSLITELLHLSDWHIEQGQLNYQSEDKSCEITMKRDLFIRKWKK